MSPRLIMIQLGLVASVAQVGFAASQPGRSLRLLQNIQIEGGVEIVQYDQSTRRLHAIGASGRMIFGLDDSGSAALLRTQTFSGTQQWDATSLAIDPAGRGFAVVSWIPSPPDSMPGMAQVIDLRTGDPVWQLGIGYHPDCLMFSDDGQYLYAANECEPGTIDRPGGITVLDLSAIEIPGDFARLGFNDANTYTLTDEYLAEGVDLTTLRIVPELIDTPGVNIEPEYIAPTMTGAWVSLQENNGLGYFDLGSRTWTRVLPLVPLSFPFDGSETDGPRVRSGEGFGLLPMPDTIEYVEIADHGYLILANEGEKSAIHELRLGEAIERGLIDAAAIERLTATYGDLHQSGLDRLYISTIDGDIDGDGDLDVLCPQGGRSVSIVDTETGVTVWNSGPQIELMTAMLFPEQYNSGDSRSDRAGPEPEGLALYQDGERILLAVGLERTNGVMLYDIANPMAPELLDVIVIESGCLGPEGMCFYQHDDRLYLCVAAELGGCLSIYEVVSE